MAKYQNEYNKYHKKKRQKESNDRFDKLSKSDQEKATSLGNTIGCGIIFVIGLFSVFIFIITGITDPQVLISFSILTIILVLAVIANIYNK